ncbi:Hypothetical protein SRAE_X000170300 [Strongyloides ratti]|uniref:Uncharacterized protein n=1 Tax=Strongyloides ratti TaxID=34506 RepID=A0A090KVR0_STRRB|nr:Hypothetical protein SRAE_X000170300 [Strongyloides ratti]CEF59961.1 Hypothetical protein SRAE_X000170300 [Strongyloides ratti]
MRFSPRHEKHRYIQNLQYKANNLSKKIINQSQIGAKEVGLCYLHQYLSSNKLHNVVCSYRQISHEENYRPYNINKQKKIQKIPKLILPNFREKNYTNIKAKDLKKNYILKNNGLKKKYTNEKIVDYTINYSCNNNETFKNENEKNFDFTKYKKEISTDFSKFLIHYKETLKIIDNLKEKSISHVLTNEKQDILCYNCSNKNFIKPQLEKIISEDIKKEYQDDISNKYNNRNYVYRKMACLEKVYKPKQEIEVPRLSGIGEENTTDEEMVDDEQEVEDNVWNDESISEMYHNNQSQIIIKKVKSEEPNNNIDKNYNIKNDNSNKEENIYSKRTSAGISTIRDIEYTPKVEKKNLLNNDIIMYPDVDRSFTEYFETPRQYSSPIPKKHTENSSHKNSSYKSEVNVKSIKVNTNNLKKWNNIKLNNDKVFDVISSLSLNNNISNKNDNNINSFSMENNKNHINVSGQLQNDDILYDKQVNESNYDLNEETNHKMPLSSNNNVISRYTFISNKNNRQDFLMEEKNKREDFILSLSNNSSNNMPSKNDVIQRNTPSLSIISSQKLQQTNSNINLISSKNDISKLDSLKSSLNTFNGDELIDNYIITSDKKNSLKSNNNLSKVINDVNSLSSLSSLTSQIIPPTSNIGTQSSQSKISISMKELNDKKESLEKNNFSPSKNQHHSTYFNEMINEEPKTVNSTSSTINISLLKKENSNKEDKKNEKKMTIYQTFQKSGNSQFISNFDDFKRNSKEENVTDVIEISDIKNKSISTNDNINLSNIKSLYNSNENIISLKGYNKNESNKIDGNDIVNYKLDLALNNKNMDENLNLNSENLFFDISSISESGNSIKNNKSDEINKSEKLFIEDNINEKDINLKEKNQSKNSNSNDSTISSLSYKNEKNKNIQKNDDNLSLSSLTTSSTITTNSSKSTNNTSKIENLSNKSSKKSSISTLLSEKESFTNGSSLLSSLPTSAGSFKN